MKTLRISNIFRRIMFVLILLLIGTPMTAGERSEADQAVNACLKKGAKVIGSFTHHFPGKWLTYDNVGYYLKGEKTANYQWKDVEAEVTATEEIRIPADGAVGVIVERRSVVPFRPVIDRWVTTPEGGKIRFRGLRSFDILPSQSFWTPVKPGDTPRAYPTHTTGSIIRFSMVAAATHPAGGNDYHESSITATVILFPADPNWSPEKHETELDHPELQWSTDSQPSPDITGDWKVQRRLRKPGQKMLHRKIFNISPGFRILAMPQGDDVYFERLSDGTLIIETGPQGRVTLIAARAARTVRVVPNTRIHIAPDGTEVKHGNVWLEFDNKEPWKDPREEPLIKTPTAIAGIRGTQFSIRALPKVTMVFVYRGEVEVFDSRKTHRVRVPAGHKVRVPANSKPSAPVPLHGPAPDFSRWRDDPPPDDTPGGK